MKTGDHADVTRTFGVKDLTEYSQLSGHVVHNQNVPEPLIGALFSYLLGVKLPGVGTMYLKQETQFRDSVLVGEALTARVEITRLRPEKQLQICPRPATTQPVGSSPVAGRWFT